MMVFARASHGKRAGFSSKLAFHGGTVNGRMLTASWQRGGGFQPADGKAGWKPAPHSSGPPGFCFPFPHVGRFAMGLVVKEIIAIALDQVTVALEDQQVLGVFTLRLVGEVEAARYDHLLVNNHDLVMCDGVLGIDVWIETLFEEDV